MGYDAYAVVIQGWKLNDFFEFGAEEEIEEIDTFFEEELDYSEVEDSGIGIAYNDHADGIKYLGAKFDTGWDKKVATFELPDPEETRKKVLDFMARSTSPLILAIAEMMKTRPLQNYLILYESY